LLTLRVLAERQYQDPRDDEFSAKTKDIHAYLTWMRFGLTVRFLVGKQEARIGRSEGRGYLGKKA
jgi:hypothetical protein